MNPLAGTSQGLLVDANPRHPAAGFQATKSTHGVGLHNQKSEGEPWPRSSLFSPHIPARNSLNMTPYQACLAKVVSVSLPLRFELRMK
jgi:hypothetical protein